MNAIRVLMFPRRSPLASTVSIPEQHPSTTHSQFKKRPTTPAMNPSNHTKKALPSDPEKKAAAAEVKGDK